MVAKWSSFQNDWKFKFRWSPPPLLIFVPLTYIRFLAAILLGKEDFSRAPSGTTNLIMPAVSSNRWNIVAGTSPQPSSFSWSLERPQRRGMQSQGRCHGDEPWPTNAWKWDGPLGDKGKRERWIIHYTGQCPGVNPALPVFGVGWMFKGARGYGQILSADINGGHFILQPSKIGEAFSQRVSQGVWSVMCRGIPLQA